MVLPLIFPVIVSNKEEKQFPALEWKLPRAKNHSPHNDGINLFSSKGLDMVQVLWLKLVLIDL